MSTSQTPEERFAAIRPEAEAILATIRNDAAPLATREQLREVNTIAMTDALGFAHQFEATASVDPVARKVRDMSFLFTKDNGYGAALARNLRPVDDGQRSIARDVTIATLAAANISSYAASKEMNSQVRARRVAESFWAGGLCVGAVWGTEVLRVVGIEDLLIEPGEPAEIKLLDALKDSFVPPRPDELVTHYELNTRRLALLSIGLQVPEYAEAADMLEGYGGNLSVQPSIGDFLRPMQATGASPETHLMGIGYFQMALKTGAAMLLHAAIAETE